MTVTAIPVCTEYEIRKIMLTITTNSKALYTTGLLYKTYSKT